MVGESPDVISPQVMKRTPRDSGEISRRTTQSSFFGLAYGGFFAFWAGTKQYLPPRQAVFSALLMTVSVVLFIAFELLQAAILSYLASDCIFALSR